MAANLVYIAEQVIPDARLGRHVQHDDASRAYPAMMAPTLVMVKHRRYVPTFDQGNLGSCTGNAAVGALMTGPLNDQIVKKAGRELTEDDAVQVYGEATHYNGDGIFYPPTDVGSSGLAVMKALVARGWLAHYGHTFSPKNARLALVLQPGIVGISWLADMDTPDQNGLVTYGGAVRGGHEFEWIGTDPATQLDEFVNSWGDGWGVDGHFFMSWSDTNAALAAQGDATFPVVW